MYLIFEKVNEHFEKINGNKYLDLAPTNDSKEKKIKKNKDWLKWQVSSK